MRDDTILRKMPPDCLLPSAIFNAFCLFCFCILFVPTNLPMIDFAYYPQKNNKSQVLFFKVNFNNNYFYNISGLILLILR